MGSLLIPATAPADPGYGPGTGVMHDFVDPFTGLGHILAMLAIGLWAAQPGKCAVSSTFATRVLCDC